MAINIKPIGVIVQKYQTNAGAAGQSYVAGVSNPRQDWATATSAAAQSWATAVTQAAGNGSFAKGVNNAGTSKWQNNAKTLGASRYPQGITQGIPAYTAGITAVVNVLANLNLPPRLPKGDPGNVNRVSAVDTALHAAKLAGNL